MAEEKEVVLTSDQQAAKDAYDADVARGALVSNRWLRARLGDAGPTFKLCPENAAAIGDYVKVHNLSWSEENLDEAFAALKEHSRRLNLRKRRSSKRTGILGINSTRISLGGSPH